MADTCTHLDTVADVTPSSDGCEDCLRIGGQWVHLRLCMTCGHVGCCDNSPNRHAAAHWDEHPDHPLIRSYEPGRGRDDDDHGGVGEPFRQSSLNVDAFAGDATDPDAEGQTVGT